MQKVAAALLMLAALMLLALVLGYWTWNWLAPRVEASAPPATEAETRVSSAYDLFGQVQRGTAVTASSEAARLLGVVAATGGRQGYAVMQLDSREIRAVREGDEVVSGLRLEEVHADHVVLSRNGARESLLWPRKDANKDLNKDASKVVPAVVRK